MPTLSSEMTSADTLQIRPIAEAFVQGHLYTQNTASSFTQLAESWIDYPANWIMMGIAIILILLYFNRFIDIIPHVVSGIFRWKKILVLENNMSLYRERNAIAAVSAIVMCLCISRLDLLKGSVTDLLSPGARTPAVFGVVFGILLCRAVIIRIFPHGGMKSDLVKAANHSIFDFLIITTCIYVLLTITIPLSGEYSPFISNVAIYLTILLWLLFLLRKCQIIASGDGQFKAFLYLCTIEILPAVLLAALIILPDYI